MKDYINIVNQPGALDSIAAGFARQADRSPNLNKAQRRESGFLTGFASGLQGSANQQRAGKLGELEEMAKQVAMADSKLKLEAGELETNKIQVEKFTRSIKPELFALGQELKSGKNVEAIDRLFKIISSEATEGLPGFKKRYGEYHHAVGGQVFFTKDGETRGYGQKELFSQLPLEEVFGDSAVELEPLLSNFQKYENKAMLEKLELDKLRADIAGKYAQTNLNNAQTRGVDVDTKAKKLEAEQPKSKYTEKSLEKIREDNAVFAQESKTQIQKDEKFASAYEEIAKQIQSSPEKAGTDLKAQFNRIRSSIMNNNYAEAKAQLATAPLFSGLKETFGGSVTDADLHLFFSTLPTFENNPKASIETALQRAKELKDGVARKKATLEVLDKSNYYDPYYSQDVEKEVNELLGQAAAPPAKPDANNNSNLTKEEIAKKIGFNKANL